MRRHRRRLPWIMSVSALLVTGCWNNIVTLAREDSGTNTGLTDTATNASDAGVIPRADVPMTTPVDVPMTTPVDVPMTTPVDVPMTTPADVPLATGEGAGSVDLLIVMDTSNSMRDAQTQFASQVGGLVSTLLDRMQLRDVRVGVVTTDLGTGSYVIPSCGVRDGDAARLNPRVNGASIATRTGILPEPPAPIFCPRVATEPYMTLRASDDAMFRLWAPSCHTTVGVGGCGLEQPLESALRALTSASSPKSVTARYVRPNAVLAVLMVTDEEDGSVRECANHDGVGPCTEASTVWDASSTAWSSPDLNLRFYMYQPGGPQDPTWPVDRYVDPARPARGLLALKPGHPERVVFGAITGVPLVLPTRADGGTDWRALLGANPNGRDGLQAMSAEGPVSMRQANADPNCATRVVPACRASGTTYDPAVCDTTRQYYAWPARRIAEVARRFDESPLCAGAACGNGMVTSICDRTNNGAPLERFATMIARRVVR